MNQLHKIKSESGLWDDFIKGDQGSFHFIYNRYIQVLYRYGCHFTCDHNLVRDCVQDVFIDLQDYRGGLTRVNDNIRLYLFKSLKNKILNSLIKLKNFNEPAFISPGDEKNIEEEIIHNETKLQIRTNLSDAFSKLTHRQREALYLKFVSGLSYKEIGEILHVNYQSTRNLIFRGIERLRECHKNILVFCISIIQLFIQQADYFALCG